MMPIVPSDFISLDGIVQAPGGQGSTLLPDDDATRAGVLIYTYRPAGR